MDGGETDESLLVRVIGFAFICFLRRDEMYSHWVSENDEVLVVSVRVIGSYEFPSYASSDHMRHRRLS